MAIKKGVSGTGITAREVTYHTGEDVGPEMKRQLTDWNNKLKKGGGAFGAVTLDPIEEVRAILESAGPPPYPKDSPECFAQRIERLHRIVLSELKSGRGDEAARFAWQLGRLYERASMKEAWEEHALRGVELLKGASKGGSERWREQGWKDRGPELQAAIDEKHAARPDHSFKRLRELVAKEFGCSSETVKRYTTNPRSRKLGQS